VIEFEQPSLRNETVAASVRVLSVAPQAIEFRVDATMIQFMVQAELVSSNSNALRRFHYFFEVEFIDDMVVLGSVTWPEDEVVVFSDGTNGDNGFRIFLPITIDGAEETVTFTEIDYSQGWAINNTEFVQFMDFSIQYVFDLLNTENLTFTDFSTAWAGVQQWDEAVNISEVLTGTGGNAISLGEAMNISEVLIGANSFVFGDAVTTFEYWDFYPTYPMLYEAWFITDALVVTEVAATDARPGAFIPGAALLGSPQ
jgi:hypothetical protein